MQIPNPCYNNKYIYNNVQYTFGVYIVKSFAANGITNFSTRLSTATTTTFGKIITLHIFSTNVDVFSISEQQTASSRWRHSIYIYVYSWKAFRFTVPLLPVTSGFQTQRGPWCRALMVSLLLVWRNCWINSQVAGGLRRHGAQMI